MEQYAAFHYYLATSGPTMLEWQRQRKCRRFWCNSIFFVILQFLVNMACNRLLHYAV